MTEFDFIRQFLQKQQAEGLVLGIGDDAAIIRPSIGFDLCFSADMLIKDKHFFSDVSPEDLAWKMLAVNISDMAAVGGGVKHRVVGPTFGGLVPPRPPPGRLEGVEGADCCFLSAVSKPLTAL